MLAVVGSNPQRVQHLLDQLQPVQVFTVKGEPTIEVANAGLEAARNHRCDAVVAIGGGSVIDTGKAIAALLTNGGEFMDYVEVIGRGRVLSVASAPFVAVPTTSGTGAEVTKNAVLCSQDHKQKVSLRSAGMAPRIAVVDPQLTLTLPPTVTAHTGTGNL